MQTDEKLNFARQLVLQAACQLREDQRQQLPSSLAAQRAEKKIISQIRRRFHRQRFLDAQTTEDDLSGPVWILDPLAGRINYEIWGCHYAISLAYYEEGQPVFGLIADVQREDLYTGVTMAGAWKNDTALPVLTGDKSLSECVAEISLDSVAELKRRRGIQLEKLGPLLRAHRSTGCAALSLCQLAQGQLDLMLSARLSPQHYAAAVILLNETQAVWGLPFQRRALISSSPTVFLAASQRTLYTQLVNQYLSVSRL